MYLRKLAGALLVSYEMYEITNLMRRTDVAILCFSIVYEFVVLYLFIFGGFIASSPSLTMADFPDKYTLRTFA